MTQVLLSLVGIAQKNGTHTLTYCFPPGNQKATFDLKVEDPAVGDSITVMEGGRKDPISVLQEYGYLRRIRPNTVILLPSAFDAAQEYQWPFEVV
jgi:hypothetical protein